MKKEKVRLTFLYQRRKLLRDLRILQDCKAQYISEADLSENFIDSLAPFRNYKFCQLQFLNLSSNFIISIEPFSHCEFPALIKLYLFDNSIVDITPLSLCKAEKLKEVRLGFSNKGNQISDVSNLGQCIWPDLEQLTLDSNDIEYLQPLANMPFKLLTHLYISNNKLSCFETAILNQTQQLKALSLRGNNLTNLKFLAKCNLPAIEYINLAENNIVDLECLFRTNFNRLSKFSIAENQIIQPNYFLKCERREVSTIIYSNSLIIYRELIDQQIYQKYLEWSRDQ